MPVARIFVRNCEIHNLLSNYIKHMNNEGCSCCFMLSLLFHVILVVSCCPCCFVLSLLFHVVLVVSCCPCYFLLSLSFHVFLVVSCCPCRSCCPCCFMLSLLFHVVLVFQCCHGSVSSSFHPLTHRLDLIF